MLKSGENTVEFLQHYTVWFRSGKLRIEAATYKNNVIYNELQELSTGIKETIEVLMLEEIRNSKSTTFTKKKKSKWTDDAGWDVSRVDILVLEYA